VKLSATLLLFLFAIGGAAQETRKPMVAVLPFSSRVVDSGAMDGLMSALSSELINTGKFRVMERSQMEGILKEQGFQQSGACDGAECAVEMGKILSVNEMVLGTIAKVGNTYTISARLVSVKTGEVVRSLTRNSKAEIDAILTDVLPQVARDLASSPASFAVEPATPTASRDAPVAGILTDSRDGHRYRTVKIGNQVWLAQNLNFSTSNSWCYGADTARCSIFGRLYNWYRATEVCPSGWHLPRPEEWDELADVVGGSDDAGQKLKTTGGWSEHGNGFDAFGYGVLPGGRRSEDGISEGIGSSAYFWTASRLILNNARTRGFLAGSTSMERGVKWFDDLKRGLSVRCVEDTPAQ
jgi:uncharacterized protein (TIGR02145 family)